MKFNTVKRILNEKIEDWLSSIEDEELRKLLRKNVIVSGGFFTSMMANEPYNDVDVYFKTAEAVEACLLHYTKLGSFALQVCRVPFKNIEGETEIRYFVQNGDSNSIVDMAESQVRASVWKFKKEKAKYSLRVITCNAVNLSGKVQLITRFYGQPEEIHRNYDFDHAKCWYDHELGKLVMPASAMSAMLQKRLVYTGSLYPLCSLMRTRKFLRRGWTIDIFNMLRILTDIKKLDFNDMRLMRDQLLGVDVAYVEAALATDGANDWSAFMTALGKIFEHMEEQDDDEGND